MSQRVEELEEVIRELQAKNRELEVELKNWKSAYNIVVAERDEVRLVS